VAFAMVKYCGELWFCLFDFVPNLGSSKLACTLLGGEAVLVGSWLLGGYFV